MQVFWQVLVDRSSEVYWHTSTDSLFPLPSHWSYFNYMRVVWTKKFSAFEGLLFTFAVNEIKTNKPFFGFNEWSIGNLMCTRIEPHCLCSGSIIQSSDGMQLSS